MADSVPEQVIQAVVSKASATGWPQTADTFEPKSGPTSDIHFSVNMMNARPTPSRSLVATSFRVELAGRLYINMLREPQGDIDGDLLAAGWDLFAAFSGGFTLGGIALEVDLLSEYGDPLSVDFGYLTIDKWMYRVASFVIPVILDDQFVQAP